jgi:hypothetical protein
VTPADRASCGFSAVAQQRSLACNRSSVLRPQTARLWPSGDRVRGLLRGQQHGLDHRIDSFSVSGGRRSKKSLAWHARERNADSIRPLGNVTMSDILTPLTIDFLAWLAAGPRDYVDVMDAWRTSCPRLTVWEDAIDADLVARVYTAGQATRIELTERGAAFLSAYPR